MRTLLSALLCLSLLVCSACDKPHRPGPDDAPPDHPPAKPSQRTLRQPIVDRDLTLEDPSPASPAAELATANDITDETERLTAIADVAWNHLETDPEIALQALESLPADHEERILIIQHFALLMAEDDPEAALDWAETRSSETEIAAAKGQVALALAETDPERAANLLSESGIEGRDFDVVVVEILERWAATSPPAAADWVVQFPPGEFREAGIKSVISEWAQTDPAAAATWTRSLPEDAIRSEAAAAMAEIIAEESEPLRSQLIELADPSILEALQDYETLREIEIQDAEM